MVKNKWCVYKHTAPNQKVYIGITSRNPLHRWNHGNGYSGNQHFYRAIQKYGWDNFQHEILFSDLTREEACQKEIELIAFYHSSDSSFGYNVSLGGNVCSNETRKKLSESHKGLLKGKASWAKNQHFSEEHKLKISLANKNKPKTDEHCKNISENRKGKMLGKENHASKRINKYTLNGDFINSYDCIYDALKEMNLPKQASHISDVCKGKRKTAYGYVWKYEEGDAV